MRFGVKVLFQMATLFWVILKETKKPSHVLIQVFSARVLQYYSPTTNLVEAQH